MKTILVNKKDKIFKLIPESPEDLWHLSLFINKEDIIESRTKRKITKEGSKKQIIKIIFVKLSVEKVEFRKESEELKILGKIIESNEEISGYHSLHIRENNEITIIKQEVNEIFLKKILEKDDKRKLLGMIFDNHDAIIFEIMSKRIKILERIKVNYGKRFKENINKFEELFKTFDDYAKREYSNIILGYSVFWDKTIKAILEKRDWAKKVIWANINNPTETGIYQLLRSNELKALLNDFRIKYEEDILNEALKRMKNGEKVAYGNVETEVNNGNVETLIISEDKLIEDYEKYKDMMEKTEKYKGSIVIVETDEIKKRLNNLGGIVAFLRY